MPPASLGFATAWFAAEGSQGPRRGVIRIIRSFDLADDDLTEAESSTSS